jgi:hypothetical protein
VGSHASRSGSSLASPRNSFNLKVLYAVQPTVRRRTCGLDVSREQQSGTARVIYPSMAEGSGQASCHLALIC